MQGGQLHAASKTKINRAQRRLQLFTFVFFDALNNKQQYIQTSKSHAATEITKEN